MTAQMRSRKTVMKYVLGAMVMLTSETLLFTVRNGVMEMMEGLIDLNVCSEVMLLFLRQDQRLDQVESCAFGVD